MGSIKVQRRRRTVAVLMTSREGNPKLLVVSVVEEDRKFKEAVINWTTVYKNTK